MFRKRWWTIEGKAPSDGRSEIFCSTSPAALFPCFRWCWTPTITVRTARLCKSHEIYFEIIYRRLAIALRRSHQVRPGTLLRSLRYRVHSSTLCLLSVSIVCDKFLFSAGNLRLKFWFTIASLYFDHFTDCHPSLCVLFWHFSKSKLPSNSSRSDLTENDAEKSQRF